MNKHIDVNDQTYAYTCVYMDMCLVPVILVNIDVCFVGNKTVRLP